MCDIVVGACIRSCSSPELVESLIKLLTSDVNKIDAYILSAKATTCLSFGNKNGT